MTAPEMLSALRECGAAVSVDGDALVIKAPRGALSAELRGALPERLQEIRNVFVF